MPPQRRRDGGQAVVVQLRQRFISEQPREEGVALLIPGRAPGQHQPVPRPGEGHIGQPLPLLLFGEPLLPIRLVARAPAAVQVQIKVGSVDARRMPAPADPARTAPPSRGGFPQVGADHQREFQALAAVDRDHRHRPISPVAVGLVLLRHHPVLRQPQPAQPVGRGRGPQLLAMEALLHQLGHLLQVRQ